MTWHDNNDTLNAVASWAIDQSLLVTVDEVLSFYEKPWNYDEIHEGWEQDQ